MERLGRRQQRRLDVGSQEAAAALQEQLAAAAADIAAQVAEETLAEAEARRLVPLWAEQPDRQQPLLHQSIHQAGLRGCLGRSQEGTGTTARMPGVVTLPPLPVLQPAG